MSVANYKRNWQTENSMLVLYLTLAMIWYLRVRKPSKDRPRMTRAGMLFQRYFLMKS